MLDGKRLTKNVAVELTEASRLQVGGLELSVSVQQADSGLGKTLGWGRPDDRPSQPAPAPAVIRSPDRPKSGGPGSASPFASYHPDVSSPGLRPSPVGDASRDATARAGPVAGGPRGRARIDAWPLAGRRSRRRPVSVHRRRPARRLGRPGRAPAPAAGGVRRVVRRPAQGLRAVRRRGRRSHDPRQVGAASGAHRRPRSSTTCCSPTWIRRPRRASSSPCSPTWASTTSR